MQLSYLYHIDIRFKTETHAIILSNRCRDNICLPPSSPMVDFYHWLQWRKNLKTERPDLIDTMLKAHIQVINIL